MKEAIMKVLVEKGDYATLANIFGNDARQEESNKLTKLITPISSFADLLTENAKGAFIEDLQKRLDDSVQVNSEAALKELRTAHSQFKQELTNAINVNREDLNSEIIKNLQKAQIDLEVATARYADSIVNKKAEEMFVSLGEQAKLTEDEIESIIEEAALSVESQIKNIVGEYVAETGISTDQIIDFKKKVTELIPTLDLSNISVDWRNVRNAPSVGGTNTHLVRQIAQEVVDANPGGGYTNLTEFVDQTAWRLFYSDGSGDVTELALGADGTFLKSNGASSAPSFAVPAGSGDVSKVGTPVNNQVGVWTGDGTIEGTSGLTYDGSALGVTGNITVTGTVDGRDVATDGSKLDGIEANADVTDATNVEAAGALMDSEVTNLAAVKAFDPTDYTPAPEVVSGSLTAVNRTFYVNVASATYTDPTPVEGEGFAVFVRNGTATVGGTGYSTAGTIVHRIYHSGAWANYVYQVSSTFATAAQGSLADTAVQPGDNVSDLTNDAGYVTTSGYVPGGTDVALADGGTGASLTDPNDDRIMFWDDSAGAVTWLTASTGLTISGTNMTVLTSSSTQTGIVELATDAETVTGTDTARATTPANISARLAAPGTIGGTTPGAATFTTVTTTGNIELGNASDTTLSRSAAGVLAVEGAVVVTKPTNFHIKAITIESPTASEDITLFFTDDAITITQLNAVSVGTTPSVTYTIRHGSDRSAAGNEVVTSGSTTTSTTTGDEVTSFNDATIPAGSWVWLETTATSGTVTNTNITIEYTVD